MIDISKGRYWDLPWSLVESCTRCSPGCKNCWALAYEKRFHKGYEDQVFDHPERFSTPLKRRKPTVYAVWNDLFHEEVKEKFIAEAWEIMTRCPHHTFLVLTKRPQHMLSWANSWKLLPFSNIYLGLTVCNQAEADEKIPVFLQVPGKKFLSIEPMLGEIELRPFLNCFNEDPPIKPGIHFLSKEEQEAVKKWEKTAPRMINAVILGGETGPGARPMHPDWVRSVRDQCAAAGVPFFMKGMGEWEFLPKTVISATPVPGKTPPWGKYEVRTWDDGWSIRVGKKEAGRLLDGREHNDLPWRVAT
jgi:protein gp37